MLTYRLGGVEKVSKEIKRRADIQRKEYERLRSVEKLNGYNASHGELISEHYGRMIAYDDVVKLLNEALE